MALSHHGRRKGGYGAHHGYDETCDCLGKKTNNKQHMLVYNFKGKRGENSSFLLSYLCLLEV